MQESQVHSSSGFLFLRGDETMRIRSISIAALGIALLGATCLQLSGQTNTASANPTPAQAVASGDPWPWPAIPGCLSDPGTSTGGKADYSSPICPIYDLLLSSGEVNLQFESARQLNGKMDGVLYPAFLPGTEVVTFVVTTGFIQSFKGPNGRSVSPAAPSEPAKAVGGAHYPPSAIAPDTCSTQQTSARDLRCSPLLHAWPTPTT